MKTLLALIAALSLSATVAEAAVYGTPDACGLLREGVAAENIAGDNAYLDDIHLMPERGEYCRLTPLSGHRFSAKCGNAPWGTLGWGSSKSVLWQDTPTIVRTANSATVTFTDAALGSLTLSRCP